MAEKKISNEHRKYVQALVGHYFPGKKLRIVPLGGGLTNKVFGVKAGSEDLVVRLGLEKDKINSFLKEQWAVTQARKKKIPVPEILEVGISLIPVAYMISRKVSGVNAYKHIAQSEILHDLGKLASIIHSIQTTGYGHTFDWSENSLSKNEQWRQFIMDEWKGLARLETLKKLKMISPLAYRHIKVELNQLSRWKGNPCLHHGDLRLKNTMVDTEGKIIALIDWEDCTSAIGPAWDLSIALHDLSIEDQQRFLEGYGIGGSEIIKLSKTIKVFNLLNYVPAIEQIIKENKKPELEFYRARMHGAMDMYTI